MPASGRTLTGTATLPTRLLVGAALVTSLTGCTSDPVHGGDVPPPTARRAPTNAVTVDSTGDADDARAGDDLCADDTGHCTLRAAIEEANRSPDLTVVRFAIPARGNPSRPRPSVIRPRRPLPAITRPVRLDGYSQPGATANTAPSPKPFNGALLIVIDGSGIEATGAADGITVTRSASGSRLSGVVVSAFSGSAIQLDGAGDVSIHGCYLGTDARGLLDRGNGVSGVQARDDPPAGRPGIRLGGGQPADRNIISGNDDNAAYPRARWHIAGNYIGLGSDGRTVLPNGTDADSAGALSIDDAADVTVGGTRPGDANVISGNASYGIAPERATRLSIRGNLIGIGPDGRSPMGNGSVGVLLHDSDLATIAGNRIGFNPYAGVLVSGSRGVTIGGRSSRDRNVISGNGFQNVALWAQAAPNIGVRITGNDIGVGADGSVDVAHRSDIGISLAGSTRGAVLGGPSADDANVIAGSVAPIAVLCLDTPLTPKLALPSMTAVLGNRFVDAAPASAPLAPVSYLAAADHSVPPDILPDEFAPLTGASVDPDCAAGGPPMVTATGGRAVARASGGIDLTLTYATTGATRPGDRYRAEIYRIATGDDATRSRRLVPIGAAETTLAADGTGRVRLATSGDRVTGEVALTLTPLDASSPSGYGPTSELSAPLTVTGP
ncbi:MAG: right-handed parallel beta-helix repeat-containing protein [Acidimicrobiales bacterium]